jgi:hypothetical protein
MPDMDDLKKSLPNWKTNPDRWEAFQDGDLYKNLDTTYLKE